jgi:hypothetical protein
MEFMGYPVSWHLVRHRNKDFSLNAANIWLLYNDLPTTGTTG